MASSPGIAADDFIRVLGCRVAVVRRLDVCGEQTTDPRQSEQKVVDHGIGVREEILLFRPLDAGVI